MKPFYVNIYKATRTHDIADYYYDYNQKPK